MNRMNERNARYPVRIQYARDPRIRTRSSFVSTGLSGQKREITDIGVLSRKSKIQNPNSRHNSLRHAHKDVFEVRRLCTKPEHLYVLPNERSQHFPLPVRLTHIRDL